ncbi:MAG: hypothetical protein O4803_14715 [Trichodesmium sp. St15_bin1_1]|nr:hypothetical protein [Trichodesmium sp. MAG_R02]MDE5075035.1 hypothetical protein [Trichodesmium sp. St5_bin2_1]MDE5082591.1 hypothetical protein [Trichodesmium sp. St18_bin1]MDE5086696.1 hypothetical protein [Trichodesmium sp. St16_bin2-tuft]MDE5105673.1 hypothetical protein [Trichodesmium sp. St17_bin3_1_1]MDE5110338.1 hypothetical protein [Trichodesmium sp. St7_bin2_1]MDE5115422.1 hypothetical protein [Trichodesmium sp. St15_bin1_1]MDE5117801.1 hypothetical protein [Trichodesmium sp. S
MKFGNLAKIVAGVAGAAATGYGVKKAVDYFQNRGQEEPDPETTEDAEVELEQDDIAFATMETESVQPFLDASFGAEGRYVPIRPPKVFEYQEQNYMVIWAYDNEKEKNQLLAFKYTEDGRKMLASVGYTADATDYNVNLDGTNLAVEISGSGEQITSGQGETDGTEEVDLVPIG